MAGKTNTATKRTTTKRTELSLRDVLDFIVNADDDTRQEVNSFTVDCLKQSRRTKAAAVRAQVKVGDTIRLHGLRERNLEGVECEVVAKGKTRLTVRLPEGRIYGRYRGGAQVTVPGSACEVIEGQQ